MKIIILITLTTTVLAQNNSLFDFLNNYEEVTPAPLKSISALTKCGEGAQLNKFVCVPYYNCNPTTNMVEANPEIDGSRIFDVRMGEDDPKCDHYLEVCCQLGDNDGSSGVTPGTGGSGSGGSGSGSGGSGSGGSGSGGSGGSGSGSGGSGSGSGGSGGSGSGGSGGSGSGSGGSGSGGSGLGGSGSGGSGSGGSGSGGSGGSGSGGTSRLVNCGIRNNEGLDFTVAGKTNEANYGEFPWMVAILRKKPAADQQVYICGGSIIGPRVILTGAHCVQNVSIDQIKVRGGEWDSQTRNERIPYQERNVDQRILHEHFIRSNLYNDVALLILDRPFTKTDSIGTVCLPQNNQHFDSNECFAMGWGKDKFGLEGQYAVILKKIQMPLVHNQKCQRALRTTRLGTSFILHRSFICAGGEPNLDTCTGDGGSPLVCPDPKNPKRYLQVGAVAWGIGCGGDQIPGVYVDVANFRTWIDMKLQELGIGTDSYTL